MCQITKFSKNTSRIKLELPEFSRKRNERQILIHCNNKRQIIRYVKKLEVVTS